MENGIPFRKGITPQNIKKCGWSMKKERGFYQKPRSFALFWGISAVFPAGQAVGRVGMLDDVARQGEQGDGVGDDHELVEHVAQLPDEVVGHRGAEEDENQREQRVDVGALFAEEVDHVDLAE